MKKALIASVLGVFLFLILPGLRTPVRAAEVIVKMAPPPPVSVVVVGRAPSARHVWIPGHWMIPPRPGAVWVAPRWVHRGGGYVFVAGFWR